MNQISQKLKKIIDHYSQFVISSHQNVDGDGLGSALSLHFLLQSQGKKSTVVYDGNIPYFYQFLPGIDEISSWEDFSRNLDAFPQTVFWVLDCSNPARLGGVERLLPNCSLVVNLDHHPDNSHFGDINLVCPQIPASSLLVYQLIKDLEVALNREMATNILTGIITDTGGFQFFELDQKLIGIIDELVGAGASMSTIMRHAFHYRSVQALKLLGRALENLWFDSQLKYTIIHLSQEDFLACQAKEEDAEGIVDYGLFIPGAEITVFFKEVKPKNFKVSLRSRGKINVLPVAHQFGGGGHLKAAGFKISGSYPEVNKKVIAFLKEFLAHPQDDKETLEEDARRSIESL
ncbi:MAG: bifunctional oligoribonuclease and phosphatase NrnA [Candidatus Atribacteria bacterium]|nr:bifunctional oligoribonuclease and phosphatase NrnA [Candidatus Atribacteria bacterium]